MDASADAILEALAPPLCEVGLDLIHPFRVAWYQAAAPEGYALPEPDDRLAVLVGNSRALWPHFVSAVRADPGLHADPHPIDRWTRDRIEAALAPISVPHRVYWAFEPGLALQRLAHAVGAAHLGPAYLCIHPDFGPWFGMRAVVVFDAPGPEGDAPPAPNFCESCPAPCVDALEEAQRVTRAPRPTHQSLRAAWRLWADVRLACPVGADERYAEPQLRYHYTKDRAALTALD